LAQFCTGLMRATGMAEYPTPVQMQILDYLENGPKRRVIGAFRGCGKSTLSAMYLLWRLYNNPEEKCLVVSASLTRSEAMTAWMLKTMGDVDWLRHMLPDAHDGRYSRIAFDVGTCQFIEQSPSVRAAGVSGQITGSRASIILCDDVETTQTSLTQTQREKLRNVLNEMEVILKPGEATEIVYLGTPHSATDSIYFCLQRELNYSMRLWPSRVPADLTPYKGCLAPLIEKRMGDSVGKPTDTRFSEDELVQRELSMSSMQAKLQLQLDATLSDIERYPLRCADWMVITVDQYLPEVMAYEKHKAYALEDLPCCGMAHDSTFYRPREQSGSIGVDEVPTVMTLDPSGGGADEFAWCVMKAWGGSYYVLDVGGKLGGVDEAFWKKLASKAKQYGVNEIVVESNFGGLEIYSQVLKPYLRAIGAECRIEPIRSNQRKELRIIDTLAPVLQTHRVAVDRRVVENDAELVKNARDDRDVSYSLFYQLTRLTYDRGSLLHDDRVDATAMAVQWFQEQAAQDAKVRQRDRAKELLLASVENEDGWALMNVQRQAMGMTLEQCHQAEGGSSHGSWL
ncbi:MAG: hypothetical protein CBC13_12220, partial [Planctomycetia bacterium TMED53]